MIINHDSYVANEGNCNCQQTVNMQSWKNGTKCRDGVKVLWCPEHLAHAGNKCYEAKIEESEYSSCI